MATRSLFGLIPPLPLLSALFSNQPSSPAAPPSNGNGSDSSPAAPSSPWPRRVNEYQVSDMAHFELATSPVPSRLHLSSFPPCETDSS